MSISITSGLVRNAGSQPQMDRYLHPGWVSTKLLVLTVLLAHGQGQADSLVDSPLQQSMIEEALSMLLRSCLETHCLM